MMKKCIQLLEIAEARIPGGSQPINDTIKFQIAPQKQFEPPLPICRLSFDILSEATLGDDFALSFSLRYINSKPKYDILAGDIGIPEIHIIFKNGEYFSFKRGNIKDFFNLDKSKEYQAIKLPFSWFLRNSFVKKESRDIPSPFTSNVDRLTFDFLRCPDTFLQVEMKNMQIVQIDRPLPPVTDFIDILHAKEDPDQSIAISFRDELSMQITPKEHAKNIPDLILKIYTQNNESIKMQLKAGSNYLSIKLNKFGANELYMLLSTKDKKVSESRLNITRCRPHTISSKNTNLGISDEANFRKFSKYGGLYHRRVFTLNALFQKDSFALNSLLSELKESNKKWIIAFKAMPSFLSKNVPHSHRYGPLDLALYEKNLNNLFETISEYNLFAVEAWNEANVIHEWQDDFKNLFNMQRILWDTIKLHSPKTLVLSPSSTSWDFNYFEKLFDANILQYCDGLAMHGYTYNPKEFVSLFDQLDATLENLSFRKDVFITEIGFRVPAFSIKDQALYLTLFTLEAYVRNRIKAILWFRFQNPRPESISNYNQNMSAGYAMFGFQGVYSRPMVSTYVLLDRILSKSRNGSVTQIGTYRQYTFDLAGEIAYATYDETGLLKSKLPKDRRESHLLVDIFGNQISEDLIVEQKLIFILPPSIFNDRKKTNPSLWNRLKRISNKLVYP